MSTENDYPGMELVKLDFQLVHQDILSRRGCRAAMFLTTVTALGTAGFALIAMIESKPLGDDWRKWVSLGMLIPLSTLFFGILVLIQKTRSIHQRVAYLAALGECLRKGDLPKNHSGWAAANIALERCRARAHGKKHPRSRKLPCNRSAKNSCAALGAGKANRHSAVAPLIRTLGPLRSFTALTATIYAMLLIAVGSATLLAFWRGLNMRWTADVVFALIPIGLLTSVNVAVLFYAISRASMKSEPWLERLRLTATYSVATGFLYAVPTSVIRLLSVWPESWTICFGFAFVGVCNILGGLGVVLVHQLYHLRKGKHSLETYYQAWIARFARCPVLTRA